MCATHEVYLYNKYKHVPTFIIVISSGVSELTCLRDGIFERGRVLVLDLPGNKRRHHRISGTYFK